MNSDLCRLTQFPRQNMSNETLHLRNFFYCCACISYLIPCVFSDRLQYLYRQRSSICQFDGHTEVSYANSLVVSSHHTEAMLKGEDKTILFVKPQTSAFKYHSLATTTTWHVFPQILEKKTFTTQVRKLIIFTAAPETGDSQGYFDIYSS